MNTLTDVAEYSYWSVERRGNEQKSNSAHQSGAIVVQFTASKNRILSRLLKLQASSNDSRLIGSLPYHLRKSLGVLDLDDFATKSHIFASHLHCSELPK